MSDLLKTLHTGLTHGVTSLMGVISVVCGTGSLLGLIPTPYTAIVMGICGVANGLGLIAAPDANKVQLKG